MDKDKAVEKALLQRALGYDYEENIEEKVIVNGRVKTASTKKQKKHIPPDFQALRFWLLNKKPDVYRDKQSELDGNNATLTRLDEMLAEVWRFANDEKGNE